MASFANTEGTVKEKASNSDIENICPVVELKEHLIIMISSWLYLSGKFPCNLLP